MSEIDYLGQADFESTVVKADGPVLVDFYADWCYPCRVQLSYLEKIAENDNSLHIVRVNVNDHPKLAKRFDVRSVPSLLVFRNGQAGKLHKGTANEKKIRALLKA